MSYKPLEEIQKRQQRTRLRVLLQNCHDGNREENDGSSSDDSSEGRLETNMSHYRAFAHHFLVLELYF